MKTNAVLFVAIVCVFPFYCFAQHNVSNAPIIATTGNTHSPSENKSNNDLVIVGYYVEETINMTFGKRVTKYEVSKLDMVYTNDLGPNNTRVVMPIYRKPKVKAVEASLQSKKIVDTMSAAIQPIKVEVIAPTPYVKIDVADTYGKVLDKGYKSAEMLKKVADRAYFEGDLATAAKYYEELLAMDVQLDDMYYYRYAQSLKGIDQTEKANEAMLLFESKNIGNNVVRHNKVVRN
ncbi:hypothetical protein IRZ83_07015 [Flavobacterium sp. JLP]|uniref:hypothetical protein n=1 Tax=unclassified Flavobacterium TaxID=196869 RepID=UPI00188DAC3D|nr:MULTISPECIES: hypothetical protein [unclassified Flavobacterium]MBF4492303.1 hypothetical protein [Flavobacterium sp. MR2016-29]MBF4506418.1 hypothetical protein [Flavobacterium sp. JLP]